jgi:hypothetical protein
MALDTAEPELAALDVIAQSQSASGAGVLIRDF